MSIYRYNYKGNYLNLRSSKAFMSIYRYNYKGNYLNPQEFKDFHVHLQVQL